MMDKESLRAWFSEKTGLDPDSLDDDRPIFTGGLLDSFDLVELVALVETQCGKRVRPLDINMRNFDSIGKIATFGSRLTGNG